MNGFLRYVPDFLEERCDAQHSHAQMARRKKLTPLNLSHVKFYAWETRVPTSRDLEALDPNKDKQGLLRESTRRHKPRFCYKTRRSLHIYLEN